MILRYEADVPKNGKNMTFAIRGTLLPLGFFTGQKKKQQAWILAQTCLRRLHVFPTMTIREEGRTASTTYTVYTDYTDYTA